MLCGGGQSWLEKWQKTIVKIQFVKKKTTIKQRRDILDDWHLENVKMTAHKKNIIMGRQEISVVCESGPKSKAKS